MRAVVLTGANIEIRDVPRPTPQHNELLVRVHACSLNRADIHMSTGRKHGRLGGVGAVAGIECAGEVIEVGRDAPAEFQPGARVMCSGGGAFAEYAVSDWGRAYPFPSDSMSFEEAATLPVALQTMHDALLTRGRLKSGNTVLFQGGSSGVGLMALQIAKLYGASLLAGSSTNFERRERLKEFGADIAFDPRDVDWVGQLRNATKDTGIDIIVDLLAGDFMNQHLEAAAIGARIVNVGRLAGETGHLDFELHALKRVEYLGVTFRSRTLEEVREITRKVRADLWGPLALGKLRLPIDRVFPRDRTADALAHMRANKHFGKIVSLIFFLLLS
jgi:NADPH:quinone reductase